MTIPRHEFYETDERLTLSVFDKGVNADDVKIEFAPRSVSYKAGDKSLVLEPLKGQIDVSKCDYTVGKVKVEIRLAKMAMGRWGGLIGDTPDVLANSSYTATDATASARAKERKNWDSITTNILSSEKPKSTSEDPNVGGDGTVNEFFQKIFADANEDTKKAMMKSYSESGGTTLSTNWEEVSKEKVTVKPPEGQEWKTWG
jgi:suppressor of G2 allele of SKP1